MEDKLDGTEFKKDFAKSERIRKAAPELLEACKGLLRIIEEAGCSLRIPISQPISSAKKAIAKAEEDTP